MFTAGFLSGFFITPFILWIAAVFALYEARRHGVSFKDILHKTARVILNDRPPKQHNDISDAQLQNNIIDLTGEVCPEMANYVRQCIAVLANKGNPDIEVWLTSGGGDVIPGLYIYDMLKTYPGKKYGRVISFASSMATIILQACDARVASKHTRITIHHIGSSFVKLDVLRDPAKLKEFVDDMESDQQRLNQILSERTGQPEDTIRKTCEQDRPMTAKEALAFSLIDQII